MTRAGKLLLIAAVMVAVSELDDPSGGTHDDQKKAARRQRRLFRELDYETVLREPDLFKHTFRVTQVVFEHILSQIKHALIIHRGLSARMQLCMFLEHVGHGLSERYLSGRYGCSASTAHEYIYNVSVAIIALDVVKWPSLDEQVGVALEYNKYQPIFDGAIGAVDGTHVLVRKSGPTKVYYVNRKGWPSVSLMCVCDLNMR